MTKTIAVDYNWNVAADGLDAIEAHLFSKVSTNRMGVADPYRQIAIAEIAQALEMEIVHVDEIEGKNVTQARDAYSRIDCLYGPGCQLETPCPTTNREANFVKVQGAWILSTTGLTAIEYHCINIFADTAARFSDISHCREMNEKAACEVARRLGLRPVFVGQPDS